LTTKIPKIIAVEEKFKFLIMKSIIYSFASMQCCGSWMFIPANFSIPDSGSASKNLNILTQKVTGEASSPQREHALQKINFLTFFSLWVILVFLFPHTDLDPQTN
jgi:hypothetical protein